MAHETTSSRLKTLEERMKRDYDLKEFTQSYNLRDLVYVLDTAKVKGKCWSYTLLGNNQKLS
jgi:hypothetical protein